MLSAKLFFKSIPWVLLATMIFTLFLTNHWPFGKSKENHVDVIDSTILLERIEKLGKLELVKYNFKEIFEYKRLSDGKLVSNALLNASDYDPDISVILMASGEAVGCIDLTKIRAEDLTQRSDTLIVQLPSPELCYHKLNLDETEVYSFSKQSWWSKLFSDGRKHDELLQSAYRTAEKKIVTAALESGLYHSVNDQAVTMLTPLLEEISGKVVQIETRLPPVELTPGS